MATKQAQNTNKITLSVPIGEGDAAITEIALRKPSPGELRGLQLGALATGDVSAIIKLVPRISTPHLSEDQVASLDLADFTSCYQELMGFFES